MIENHSLCSKFIHCKKYQYYVNFARSVIDSYLRKNKKRYYQSDCSR